MYKYYIVGTERIFMYLYYIFTILFTIADFVGFGGQFTFLETIRGVDRTVLVSADDEAGLRA